ncbi:MAG TPA: STAS domain-containing protein [Planctomycetota bacterium]|jgi:hypothetical protein|nr:STAS domain-containing protein [Planctomycetota bacterium]
MLGEWEERELAQGSVLIELEGKLRGSRARQLGEHLQELPASVKRVVLDMRDVVTVDSLGTQAIEEAHARGLELALVTRKGLELDDGRPVRALSRKGLTIYATIDDALATKRVAVAAG